MPSFGKAKNLKAQSKMHKPSANKKWVYPTKLRVVPASIALASTPKWFVTANKKETTNV
jgi:hypothetical protein